jgi:polysaccharide biosynthesis protein PslH
MPDGRILFLLPFPPRAGEAHGGSRVLAELLKRLGRSQRLALAYFRSDGEAPADSAVTSRCERVWEVPRRGLERSSSDRWRLRLRNARGLITGKPMWATMLAGPDFRRVVREAMIEWQPNIIQAEYHVMGQYLPTGAGKAAKRVLVEHEPGIQWAADRKATFGGRLLKTLDLTAWRRYEPAILRRVDAVVAFTERDSELLRRFVPADRVSTIPVALEIPDEPLNPVGSAPPTVVFVGNFGHTPNVEAAIRLAKDIHPRLREVQPQVVLQLVGADPPAAVQALASPNVVVTGRVPDVDPYLDHAAVVLAPLRLGGGMRVKVLEALVRGKALVASTVAIAGLNLRSGEHLVVADSDDEVASAVNDLLNEPDRRRMLGTAARAWAVRELSWEPRVRAYERLYERLLRQERPGC